MIKPLLTYQFEDDGMYNNQWRIYDQPLAPGLDPQFYADADSEKVAKEIFDAVNEARAKENRRMGNDDDSGTDHKGDALYPFSGRR